MARRSCRHPVLVALLALFGLVFAPGLASADAADTGIVAAGSGAVRVRPDSVRMVLGIEVQGKTVEEVQKQANEKMQRVLASLRALAIPGLQLQTKILFVEPVHATTPEGVRTAEIVGYSATHGVSVVVRKANVDALAGHASAILNVALTTGANVSGGFELFVDDPSRAQAEALAMAVKAARKNAEVMAKAAGITITGVALVSEGTTYQPMMMQAPQYGGGLAGGTPVETGEVVVSSNVTVRFTFR
ncbi:MAG: SIMPL domain-containing protein [Minicystis sp.]